MKILHVLDHSIPLHSGYTFRTRSILQHQRAIGWETYHLTSGKQGFVESSVEKIEDLQFYRTPAGSSILDRLPLVEQLSIVWRLFRRLRGLLNTLKPDIVHAHSPALNGLAALWACRGRNIPVVYECRAFWEDAAVDNGSSTEGGLRYRLTRALETYVFSQAEAVTTICQGLKDDVIDRGVDPNKITVIPNAVDLKKFTETNESEMGNVFNDLKRNHPDIQEYTLIGFFGSFYEYEGLSMLLDTMALLKQSGQKVFLLLAGGGPHEEQITQKIRDLKLDDVVKFNGRVPHEVIQEYYQAVDFMVYPRLSMRLTELVTPLKPLEAMAKGKIVIASSVGGHKELIRDGETGLLFSAGCSRSLADIIVTAIGKKGQWPIIRARARKFVEEERNWHRSVEFYREAYATACE
ncbi:MAG: glycosyltransferase, exosortase A system-associated [Cellvibrionaceae bacterium]|nr:glycosyltransferase, exosortase A system-associated [Cellvibrionaceae bacterium]|tara:strand:- start:29766 stop:30986 length:1221 start_codon:yes stop_codon:yes gene_type:complete